MPLTLAQTVGPTIEPVTTDEAKDHLRIDIPDDDSLIDVLITAARADVEVWTRRQILTATWKLYLDAWPSGTTPIRLPKPPTASVASIKYQDGDDVQQTLAGTVYQTDLISEPARIALVDGQVWPSLKAGAINAIVIEYVAGWATVAAVPSQIKHAIKLIVGDLYEHRESTIDIVPGLVSRVDNNLTIQRLLWMQRREFIG